MWLPHSEFGRIDGLVEVTTFLADRISRMAAHPTNAASQTSEHIYAPRTKRIFERNAETIPGKARSSWLGDHCVRLVGNHKWFVAVLLGRRWRGRAVVWPGDGRVGIGRGGFVFYSKATAGHDPGMAVYRFCWRLVLL